MKSIKRPRSPKMIAAKIAVMKALKDGGLQRQPCEVCGKNAEAHHDDYDKPLEVRWLCKRHHARHHRKHGPGKNAGERTMAPAFHDVVRPPAIMNSPLMDGRTGGYARARALTPEQRSESARRAALARWRKTA